MQVFETISTITISATVVVATALIILEAVSAVLRARTYEVRTISRPANSKLRYDYDHKELSAREFRLVICGGPL